MWMYYELLRVRRVWQVYLLHIILFGGCFEELVFGREFFFFSGQLILSVSERATVGVMHEAFC
jgi:hypothetical protein